ncbi:MAG: co-chaperone DjlA [Gammaproteobacteria bacterium]|jgi:DnaJ like chaperone protein
MGWGGKLIGAAVGAMAGGPVGAVLGALLGHQFDRGFGETARRPPPEVQDAFFSATFAVMGNIAKADGRVSEDEIRSARSVMHHMQLRPEQVSEAIRLFNEGKRPDYPIGDTLARLSRLAGGSHNLGRAFVEIQMQAMLSAGPVHPAARGVLWEVASQLGVGRVELAQIEALIRLQTARAQRPAGRPGGSRVAESYKVLGVEPTASDREVKTAYRRLMNQHHPDKLRARGMPDSMIPVAEEKTREIRAAYDNIRETRGTR